MKYFLVLLLALVPVAAHSQARINGIEPGTVQADVRSNTLILDAAGNSTWDFTANGTQLPFAGIPDVTHLPRAVDTTNPLICNFMSMSTTNMQIHCWRSNTATALVSGIFGGTVLGAQVNMIARYKAP